MKERLLKLINKYINTLATFCCSESVKKKIHFIKEVEEEKIVSEDLRVMLQRFADYWGPKDRDYSNYINSLINKGD